MSAEFRYSDDPLTNSIIARSIARSHAERPQREAAHAAERERQRVSAINEVVCHVRVKAQQLREAIITAFQGEGSVPVHLVGKTGRESDLGLLEGEHQLGKEHLGGTAPQLQFLDFLIDVLRHAESPSVDVGIDTAENADAHRSNGDGQ